MVSLIEIENIIAVAVRHVYISNCCELVIGLAGNAIACTVIICSRSFHNITGFYLLSLSIADLLILFTGVSYYVFSYKFTFLHPGKVTNHIAEWIFQSAGIASTLTVTTFTVERYMAICHPFFVQSIPKKSRAKKFIISIWSISALLALLPVGQMIIIFHSANHSFNQLNNNAMQYVADLWAFLYFFMPMSAITVMYVLIWLRLKKPSNSQQIADRADTRTMMMFVAIIAVFFVSWAPYYISRLLNGHMLVAKLYSLPFNEDTGILIDVIALLNLAKQETYPLSSALNPIIYSMMSKKFREAFKDLLSNARLNLINWAGRLRVSKNQSDCRETAL